MMKLAYVTQWAEDKRYTWSGSTYNLMKALEKRLDLTNYDVQMEYPGGQYVDRNSSLGRAILAKKTKKMLKNIEDEYVFQLEDFTIIKNKVNCIYMDLTLDLMVDTSIKDPEAFQVSGFQHVEPKFLENRNLIQKQFLQNADHIFVMGEFLKQHLITNTCIPEEKIVTCGAGINIDISQVNPVEKNHNRILFIGRDFGRKGGELILESFVELKKRMKDAELYIIGPTEKPYEGEMEGVFYLGPKSYEELPYYYNRCDIFCMPSKFEGYGIVFAEALAYGLPCIARNKFAMGEIIEDKVSGYLIDHDDIHDFAEIMYQALHNQTMYDYVKNHYEEYIHKYSWDRVAEQMCEVLVHSRKLG